MHGFLKGLPGARGQLNQLKLLNVEVTALLDYIFITSLAPVCLMVKAQITDCYCVYILQVDHADGIEPGAYKTSATQILVKTITPLCFHVKCSSLKPTYNLNIIY